MLAEGGGWDERSGDLLWGPLPTSISLHLTRAAERYHQTEEAERHLLAAIREGGEYYQTWIALYRFYFYKNMLPQAEAAALHCLEKAAQDLGMPARWQEAAGGPPRNEDDLGRFYLSALKAYAYLRMRQGDLETGRGAIRVLLSLDPGDRLESAYLLRAGEEDPEEASSL